MGNPFAVVLAVEIAWHVKRPLGFQYAETRPTTHRPITLQGLTQFAVHDGLLVNLTGSGNRSWSCFCCCRRRSCVPCLSFRRLDVMSVEDWTGQTLIRAKGRLLCKKGTKRDGISTTNSNAPGDQNHEVDIEPFSKKEFV